MPSDVDQYWSNYYTSTRDFIPVCSYEIKRILSFAPKNAPKTALDIGCGTGQLVRELFHSGYKVTGVDASKAAVKIACSLSVMPKSKLRYIHRDIEKQGLSKLPFASYSLITCRLVYAFIQDKKSLLKEVEKVLAAKGVLVIISPITGKVPKHKKSIAVDPEDITKTLRQYFTFTYFEHRDLGYFICVKNG